MTKAQRNTEKEKMIRKDGGECVCVGMESVCVGMESVCVCRDGECVCVLCRAGHVRPFFNPFVNG